MSRFLVFGGTTEGRELAIFLDSQQIDADLCVTTEYGKELLAGLSHIQVLVGKKDVNEIEKLLSNGYDAVIDSTHPFAKEASQNIKVACENQKAKYMRLVRPFTGYDYGYGFSDFNSVIDYLNQKTKESEKVLLSTGSKTLSEYTRVKNFKNRIVPRFLPDEEAKKRAIELGFKEENLITLQGPFSVEDNLEHIKEYDIKYLVTKDSGKTGGFPEKIEAAKLAGITPLIIERPKEEGLTLNEMKEWIANV